MAVPLRPAFSSCQRRLMADLREINNNPLHLVSAQPLPEDLSTWHANLVGPENTPYEGGIFHIILQFPSDYPQHPPSASICTALPHSHVHKDRICLDLLSDFAEYFDGVTGWSSAYSVLTVLIQLQSFLMELEDCDMDEDELSQLLCRIPEAIRLSRTYECPACPHQGIAAPWPPLHLPSPSRSEHEQLVDRRYRELLYDSGPLSSTKSRSTPILIVHSGSLRATTGSISNTHLGSPHWTSPLLSTSLPHRSPLPPPSHVPRSLPVSSPLRLRASWEDVRPRNDTSAQDAQEEFTAESTPSVPPAERAKKELICFHSKRTFEEDILGFGLRVDRHGKKIQTSMDLLSRTAFFEDGVRRSVLGEPFELWFPLYINDEHAQRALPFLQNTLSCLCFGRIGDFTPKCALDVLPKLMNTVLVAMMRKEVYASDKTLSGYCVFHRWLIRFVTDYPTLLRNVNSTVRKFIKTPEKRLKAVVPSLGEFLTLLSVADYIWEDIRDAYFTENLDRSVLWIVKAHPEFNSPTPVSDEVEATRNLKSFQATKVGKHLLLFHVHFLQNIAECRDSVARRHIAARYDRNFGLPEPAQVTRLQDFCKQVESVNSWHDFFAQAGMLARTDEELNEILRKSISRSAHKNYHSIDPVRKRKGRCRYFAAGECRFGQQCKWKHR